MGGDGAARRRSERRLRRAPEDRRGHLVGPDLARAGPLGGARRSGGEIGGAEAALEHGVDRGLDARRVLRAAEAVAQHHRRREEGRERVGDALAGDVGRRAVDRLEEARLALGAEARRGQHSQRAGQHRRLVAEDVAEEVLGDDHVEVGRARDELHRRVVDQQVVELDVGVVGGDAGRPTSRQRREVSSTLALSTEVTRGLRPEPSARRRAASKPTRAMRSISADRVRAVVVGDVAVAAAVAEVDAAGQLADDEQVGAGDPLLAQRAGVDQGRARPHRPQVREQPQPLAQAEQPLLGARRVGVGRVPLRAADRAEQDRVGARGRRRAPRR